MYIFIYLYLFIGFRKNKIFLVNKKNLNVFLFFSFYLILTNLFINDSSSLFV
jgi:hypothetical protein